MTDLLDIVGQDAAIERLQRLLGGTRRPHALLFVGPAGVGRRTTAVALARTLLCESPAVTANSGHFGDLPADYPLRQACGHCLDCAMMSPHARVAPPPGAEGASKKASPRETLSHPDFHLVFKELAAFHEDANVRSRVMQELGIDVIRSFLLDPVCQRASRGRGKVFVVLEAHLLSVAAQNAMLKTLEEPPPGVTIILISDSAEGLLPTTLSRCSLLRFGLLPRPFVMDRLAAAGVAAPEAAFWAAFTGGSVGRALKLAAQDMYEIKRDVVARLAAMNRAGDAELGEYLGKTSDSLAERNVKLTRIGETEMSKNLALRQGAGAMLELIASAFRDALTRASGCDRPLVNGDQAPQIDLLAAKFDALQIASILEQLSELEELLWRNVNAKVIWDNVVITCASAAPLRV